MKGLAQLTFRSKQNAFLFLRKIRAGAVNVEIKPPLSLLAFAESFAIEKQQKATVTRLCQNISRFDAWIRRALVFFNCMLHRVERRSKWGFPPRDAGAKWPVVSPSAWACIDLGLQ